MAAKKGGKKTATKKTVKKAVVQGAKRGRKRCTSKEICKYLEKLDAWFGIFMADYTKLRIAVCNVETKAWGEAGSVLEKRFCNGGPNDPPNPAPPPIWT